MHSGDDNLDQSWVVLQNETTMPASKMKLEIYRFPDSTNADELTDHFCSHYGAECHLTVTEIEQGYDLNGVYTLEFLQSDAERILGDRQQLLDPDDVESEIRIRPSLRAVLFHSDRKINKRMVMKSLPDGMKVVSWEQLNDFDLLAVFKRVEDADRVVGNGKWSVTPNLSATVSFYGLPSESSSAEGHMEEARAGAYGGSSTNRSMTLDFGDYIPNRHPVNSPNQNRSPYKTPTPAPRIGRLSTVRMAHDRTRTPSPLLISKDTSEGQPEEQSYTCIEIMKGISDTPRDVYELLKEHLKERFANDMSGSMENRWKATIYEQSFEPSKEIFRFDVDPSDVRKLLAQGTQYFDEGDTDTAMKITPRSLEPVISVKIISNRSKMALSEKDLKEAFGQDSQYLNIVQILKLDEKAGAIIQMETASVAALVVSTKTHRLHSGIIVEASFHLDLYSPAPKEVEKPPPITKVLVTFEETLSKVMLNNLKRKVTGAVERKDERDIIITFEREEDAQALIQTGELVFLSKRGAVMVYEECVDQTESSQPTAKPSSVKVTMQDNLSDVMLKKFMKSIKGSAERIDDRNIIITFDNFEDAENLVRVGEINILGKRGTVMFHEESFEQPELPQPTVGSSAVKIKMDEKFSDAMLSKWMKRVEGTVKRIDDQNIIITFDNIEDAQKMVEERQVILLKRSGVAELYEAPQQPALLRNNPTHVEITCKLDESPEDMHTLIEDHLQEVLQHGWSSTIFQQSYDESKNVYRFDMQREVDVGSILDSKQRILEDTPDSELDITDKYTDKKVVIKKCDNKRLKAKHVNAYLGPEGVFKSDVKILAHTEEQAILEMDTYSVASKLVSIRQHALPNGAKVEITFIGCMDSDSDGDTDDSESDTLQGSVAEKMKDGPAKSLATPNTREEIPAGTETLLVYKLLDVDEKTLFYWVKAVTGIWPLSIHLSVNEEQAVIKIPLVNQGLEWGAMQRKLTDEGFSIHGEMLRCERVHPSNSIQVNVIAANGDSVDEDAIKSHFCNHTLSPLGTTDTMIVDKRGDNVFTVTFPSDQHVATVLSRTDHRQLGYTFEVSEYYEGIGLCKPNGFKDFSLFNSGQPGEMILETSLTIRNIRVSDVETLKLKMADRVRTRGGDIKSFNQHQKTGTGVCSVKIVYEEESVAERVYRFHVRQPIEVNGAELDIEIDLPKLNDCHDEMGVRLSGLSPDLDPDKLRLYVSALSDRTVSNLSFEMTRTKAVARFSEKIDFAAILYGSSQFALDECPDLKFQQENKPDNLLAVGSSLSKDKIELNLEIFLKDMADDPDYQVIAESVEDAPDTWKIRVGSKVLANVNLYEIQQRLAGCTQLSLFADYLGLHVAPGIYKKTRLLSDCLYDKRVADFLKNEGKPASKNLAEYLQNLGFTVTAEGVITVKLTNDKSRNRQFLKNWRRLDSYIAAFVAAKCAIKETESLTEQIFNHIDDRMAELTTALNVETEIDFGKKSDEKRLWIIGDLNTVEKVADDIKMEIEAKRSKTQEDESVRSLKVPNVLSHQISYLQKINFSTEMQAEFNLRDIQLEGKSEQVTLTGTPFALEEVQNRMLDILHKMKKSQCQVHVKPLFLKVFHTQSAIEKLEDASANKGVTAVWTVDNKTIASYSENKRNAKIAMDCLSDVTWVGQYPSDKRVLEDLELDLLTTQDWLNKKAELEDFANPLFIEMNDESQQLNFAGLKAYQNHVLEEIKGFFEQNVIRKETFQGRGKCVTFLWDFKRGIIEGLKKEFGVEIKQGEKPETFEISGPRNDIANTKSALRIEHDNVKQEEYMVETSAKVQHITENMDILNKVGTICSCVITIHNEDNSTDTRSPADSIEFDNANFRTTLPSGDTVCIVQMGDITKIPCDAIVNPANERLEHTGGAAAAIVRAGGVSIQEECRGYIRRHGELKVGEVMSSDAGSLQCKKVLHAVGPKWSNRKTNEDCVFDLEYCIENIFMEMKEQGLSSIAIPPISTGIFGFPLPLAVKTIVETICKLDKRKGALPKRIILVDNKDDSLQLFERELQTSAGETIKSRHGIRSVVHQRDGNKQSTASSTTSKYLISGKLVNILGRADLEVCSGDITNRQENSLVNSVGTDMNLKKGKVAPVILSKAGPQLQQDCNALKPIQNGEVKPTDAYQMAPCKKILHCCLPQYNNNLQYLKKVVSKCLTTAEEEGHTSIAFPALGTGNLNYPGQIVAKCMIDTIIQYISTNTRSCIRDVKIVIFHADQDTQKGFDTVLTNMSASSSALTQTKSNSRKQIVTASSRDLTMSLDQKGETTINSTQLRLLEGSIIESDAEVIVNSTDSVLNMAGQVAQALLRKAGPGVKQEISKLQNETSCNGIWVSSGGNLQAKHVIHLDTDGPRRTPAAWPNAVAACLSACDNRKLTSIALPALGTGQSDIPEKEMAKYILEAVCKYLTECTDTVLRRIDIIVFKPQMMRSFQKAMQTATQEKSTRNRFFAKVAKYNPFSRQKVGEESQNTESGWDFQDEFEGYNTSNSTPARNAETKEICDGLILDIYAGDDRDIIKCKRELKRELARAVITLSWSTKLTYEEDKMLIAVLDSQAIASLNEEAKRLRIQLDINCGIRNITIVGLTSSVTKMSDLIAKKLRDMQNMHREMKEEKMVAKHIQWRYAGGQDGSWLNFGIRTNKRLEDEFSKDPQAKFDYELQDGREVFINLEERTANFGHNEFPILRADIGEEKGIAKAVPFPGTWAKPFDKYQEIQVTHGSSEFQKVKDNFERTIGNVPYHGILEVRRVQNPTLYQMYQTIRKSVAKKWGKKEEEIERVPLWHGTDELTAPKILKGKFDRGFAAATNAAAFGNGVYFARDSSYSAGSSYSKPNANGEKFMMQCRVIVGAEVFQGAQGMRAAPEKNGAIQYDCVVNDVVNPSIFVIFHDAGAYPEYIIKFE